MSIWTRITNVFRRERLQREFDAEFEAHIEEAVANGRDEQEARRAFGSLLRRREDCQDIKLSTWLETLRSDIVYGARQLWKHKVVSAAAIVSLALATGACTSAFQLIDALLLRPLPVRDPDGLYRLTYDFEDRDGTSNRGDTYEYPLFRSLRSAALPEAELMAISYSGEIEIEYPDQEEPEKVRRQYVSGWTFGTLGLKPAMGRLLTEGDDLKPGEHPVAVISHAYWTKRFGSDPGVVGKTFRMGNESLQIVGVTEPGFTGTETGTKTDLFLPTMVNKRAIENRNWGWFRTWVRLKDPAQLGLVEEKLNARQVSERRVYVKGWTGGPTKDRVEKYVNARVHLESAAAGVGGLQERYGRPLMVLAAIVLLVLLIACANVANLMAAQATARGREMALRISIGAGKWRLLQLVLIEGSLLAVVASLLGGIFAAWSGPAVLALIGSPGRPPQLDLRWDWRVLAFSVLLALAVTLLFGTIPALRASSVKPMAVLRSGAEAPQFRRKVIHALTAAQVAFCFLVLFTTGLFVASVNRLTNQPLGFSADRVVNLETVARSGQSMEVWNQTLDHLRTLPQVESASLSEWALMSGNRQQTGVWINGERKFPDASPYQLAVGSGWLETMKIPLLAGRDLRRDEMRPAGGVLVNVAFARDYFDGQNPVGKSIQTMQGKELVSSPIVGYVGDARYTDLREKVRPTIYVPQHSVDEKTGKPNTHDWMNLVVRTRLPLDAESLRKAVKQARSELRVSDVTPQEDWVSQHAQTERLLARLSSFFAIVAVVLAGVGLFGVIHYSMLQRRKEIGVRMALGAQPSDVATQVTAETFVMLLVGSALGIGAGVWASSAIEKLLFEVRPQEIGMLAGPAAVLAVIALAAAIPPVLQAIRIDPATMLRSE